MTSGRNYCVIAATTISVEATLRAIDSRPLVLIATDAIVVMSSPSGLIDVGSHHEGRRGGDGGLDGGRGGGGGGGGGAGLVKAPIHATLGANVSPPPTL